MNSDSLSRMLEVAREAAVQGGDILARSFRTEFSIARKGPIDFVTEIDLKSEQAILDRIRSEFPDHDILAEETGASARRSRFRWVIDPLDGTTNYAHGFPAFCVSIALERDGELVLGVVYDPVAEEMFWACRGAGAFLNGVAMKVSRQQHLADSLLGTGFSYDPVALRANLHLFGQFMTRAAGVRRVGSAARDLSYVACGRFEGVWEFHLQPWDVAAGIVLIEEAGGKVTDFTGCPCGAGSKQLLLTNGRIHEAMLEVLRRQPAGLL